MLPWTKVHRLLLCDQRYLSLGPIARLLYHTLLLSCGSDNRVLHTPQTASHALACTKQQASKALQELERSSLIVDGRLVTTSHLYDNETPKPRKTELNSAERQRRYRERHRNVTSRDVTGDVTSNVTLRVTGDVTDVTSNENVTRNVTSPVTLHLDINKDKEVEIDKEKDTEKTQQHAHTRDVSAPQLVPPSTESVPSKNPKRVSEEVQEVFAYWQQILGHKHSVLDAKRIKAIERALKHYRSVDVCKQAIDGCARSDFHMGRDPKSHGRVHDDITLIFRDAEHTERFLKMKASGPDLLHETPQQRAERKADFDRLVAEADTDDIPM